MSRASGLTGAPANGDSFDPSMSADGRYVAFDSRANQLSGVQRDSTPDVFVRDRRKHTTTLVSRTGGANGAKGDYTSEEPSISADGRFVAFISKATNLGGRGGTDVYVRDLRRGSTTLASRATGVNGAKGDAGSVSASISADGRVVAFSSLAGNLSGADRDDEPNVFVRNLRMHTTTLVSFPRREEAGFASLSISPDGRLVAFSSDARVSDVNPNRDIQMFVRDLRTRAVTLVSRASGPRGRPAKGGGGTFEPSFSADGHLVAFASYASNLSTADGDEKDDVFVRDLRAKTTRFVSRPGRHKGDKGDIGSLHPAISGDGRVVAFDSSASNLSREDRDRVHDAYVRALGPT